MRTQLDLQPQQRQASASKLVHAGKQADGGSSRNSDTVDEALLWQAVGLVVDQVDGLVAGYNARVSQLGPGAAIDFITPREFLTLNSMGGWLLRWSQHHTRLLRAWHHASCKWAHPAPSSTWHPAQGGSLRCLAS